MKSPKAILAAALLMAGVAIGWILGTSIPSRSSASAAGPGPSVHTRTVPDGDAGDGTSPSPGTIELQVKGGGLGAFKQFIASADASNPYTQNFREMILLSESLQPGEFAEAIALTKAGAGAQGNQMLHVLFGAWLTKDLPAAQAWYEQQLGAGDDEESGLAYTFINHLATQDPTAAVAWIERHPDMPNQEHFFSTVAARIAQRSPQEALQFIEARNLNPNVLQSAYSSVYSTWAASDPAAALAAAQSIPRLDLRQDIYRNIFFQWYRKDPVAGLAAIDSLENERERVQAYQSIIWQMALDDPGKAQSLVDRIPRGQERSQMISNVANQMANKDPQQALLWIENQNDPQGRDWAISNILAVWARKDPLAALNYAVDLPNLNSREHALSSAFGTYMNSDPERAMQWIKAVEDPAARARLLANQSYSLGKQSPVEALALAHLITSENERNNYYASVISTWSQGQPEEAIDWFKKNVSDPALAAQVAPNIAGHLAQHDTGQAVDFINSLPPEARDPALERVASSLANYDITQAMQLASQIGDENRRDNSVGNIVSNWSRYDPEGVSQWLTQQPEGKGRDRAIENFVSQIQRHDAKAATHWAAAIGDENQRRNRVVNSAREWLKQDPNAAAAWVRSSTVITDQEKERLLKK